MNNWILPETAAEIATQKANRQQNIQKQQTNELFAKELVPRYALVDAALWQNKMSVLSEGKFTYCSLFRTADEDILQNVAPYLVDMESADRETISKVVQENPIEYRVMRLHSDLDLDSLRKHLRRFLRMKTETGMYLYSRFYDPYVANCIFPNLTQEQLEAFFAPLSYLITKDVRINERRVFYLSENNELQIKYETISDVDNK